MNHTNIDQSKKLLELGLNPETADMVYLYWINTMTKKEGIDDTPTIRNGLPLENADIPCWTVGALLELMKDVYLSTPNKSFVEYYCTLQDKTGETITEFSAYNPLDATYKMMVWLLENNYIKTVNNMKSWVI